MLDVLELDAVRAPHEHGVCVRRIDDVGDLEPAFLGLADVVVCRVHAQSEVVEQRPLRLLRFALLELDVCVACLQPTVLDVEAELGELRERRLGVCDAERNVVEVVGDSVVGGHERKRDALRALELDSAFFRPLDR